MELVRKAYGVPAYRGAFVRYEGGPIPVVGTITSAKHLRLRVRVPGRAQPIVLHPTWKVVYLNKRGE